MCLDQLVVLLAAPLPGKTSSPFEATIDSKAITQRHDLPTPVVVQSDPASQTVVDLHEFSTLEDHDLRVLDFGKYDTDLQGGPDIHSTTLPESAKVVIHLKTCGSST